MRSKHARLRTRTVLGMQRKRARSRAWRCEKESRTVGTQVTQLSRQNAARRGLQGESLPHPRTLAHRSGRKCAAPFLRPDGKHRLPCSRPQYNTLQHSTTRCNTQHSTTCCSIAQHVATQYNMLQHSTTRCNTVHHVATHFAAQIASHRGSHTYIPCSARCGIPKHVGRHRTDRALASEAALTQVVLEVANEGRTSLHKLWMHVRYCSSHPLPAHSNRVR
jgi:hypothetical protein